MSSTAAGSSDSSRYLDFDEYVDLKLQKTRSTIKSTDILVALAGVAAMFLGYLLVFIIFDQWVISGGFGIGLRWTLLSTLLLLTAAWLTWKVGLPYFKTVNRLFAAKEIERADSELKSNLLNLVDLRSSGRTVDPSILRALEKNAAVGLQKIDVAQAIDHRPLMRMAYVLLAVVVVFCLYALFSPKKISNSIWRGLLPAAEVGVATRTEIINVSPGNTTVLARQTVLVDADIAGDVPEKVWLHYTTADGKFRDEPVELRTDGESPTRFHGTLPGVVQDLTYVVRAGDAVSPQYRVTVNQPPSATIDQVKFQFPPYMKLEATEQVGGQIDSWEGTKVTVTAHTNMAVKSAKIEFLDAPPKPNGEEESVTVSSDGQHLTATWTLGFNSDGTFAKFYQIQCVTESGATDPTPTVYGLNIRADQRPEVTLLEPVRDQEVPANATVPLLVEAHDPDFELSHINLHIKKNGQPIHKEPLSEGHQQRLLLKHDLKLERFVARPGDLFEIWVQAFDNKQPRPNSKVTSELKLKIVDKISDKEAQQKLSEDRANRDQRLKEAEQEQNPDKGADEAPQKDPGDAQQPRDDENSKRTEQGANPAAKPDAGGEGANSDRAQQEGAQKNQGKSEGQNSGQNGSGEQQRSNEGNSKEQTPPSPLDPDGENDKEALERLMEALKEHQSKPSPSETGKSETGTQGSQGKEAKQSGSSRGNQAEPKDDSGAGSSKKPDSERPNPSNKEGKQGPKSAPSKTNMPTEGEPDSPEPSPMPMPGSPTQNSEPKEQTAPKNDRGNDAATGNKQTGSGNSGNKNKEAATKDKPEDNGAKEGKTKPDKPAADGEASGKPMGQEARPGSPEGADNKTPDGASPDSKKEADPTGQEGMNDNKRGPKRPEEAGADTNTPDKKAGPDGAGGTPESPKPNGTNSSKEKNPPKGGNQGTESPDGTAGKSESKTSKGDGEEKRGPASGEEERTGESKNAEQKMADGSETGKAQPDRDPMSKPTPSKNPGLERDPMEKPEVRSSDKPGTDPGNAAKESENKVKNPKPQRTDTEKQKIEQQSDDSAKPQAGKNPQQRDGDPNAADEMKKGQGQKEQRSKTGSGGEGGTSKQDKDGDPGSKESGEGDATDRSGTQQSSKKQTDQQGSDKQGPGAGAQGENGQKKNGASGKDGTKQSSEKGSSNQQEGASKEGGEPGDGEAQGEGAAGQRAGGKTRPGQPGSRSSDKPGNQQGGNQAGGNGIGNDTPPEGSGTAIEGDAANLEFKKQATELVLKRLQDGLERGEIEPELLEKMGWTEDQMRRFTERLSKHLQETKSTEETPESQARRQQFEETLKSLNLNKQGTTRQGDKSPQRDVNQFESRKSAVPKEYRSAAERFSREVTRQKNKTTQP